MKTTFFTFSFCFACLLANAQQWEVRWSGGPNYTFLAELFYEQKAEPCPPSSGYCSTNLQAYELTHSFDGKPGGFSHLQFFYQWDKHWAFRYGLGGQLQRYQRHIKYRQLSLPDGVFPGSSAGSKTTSSFTPFPIDPETGNTRLWYLRHQTGASYLISPKLSLDIDGWADILLHAAEYQMKFGFNSEKNMMEVYGTYDKSGAGFKHVVVGLQAGLSYTFVPGLRAALSYSRGLTPVYFETEDQLTQVSLPGKSYANQLQLGISYSLLAR